MTLLPVSYDHTPGYFAMNAGFLFAATNFKEWCVELSLPEATQHRQPVRIAFDDWFRLLREVDLNAFDRSIVKPLNALWLHSFRFMEAGVLQKDCIQLIEEVPELVGCLNALKGRYSLRVDARIERVVSHLYEFSKEALKLQAAESEGIASPALPIVGSVWDVSFETLVIHPTTRSLSMHYKQSADAPFQLTVTPRGFVSKDGHEGFWAWGQHPGGRLTIQVGGDYPTGWGWYNQTNQHEMRIFFYKSAYARAYERMHWVRCG